MDALNLSVTLDKITEMIRRRKNFLCIGIDPDPKKMPVKFLDGNGDLKEGAIVNWAKSIIAATANHCVSYKPNSAFFEAHGPQGLFWLKEIINYIRDNHPEHFIILDAKRGDIGNTSAFYGKALEYYQAHAITVHPGMGFDSVEPMMLEKKFIVVLVATSNEGAKDFQRLELADGRLYYQKVADDIKGWGSPYEIMCVVGGTDIPILKDVRARLPHHFFLVPGVGAQGGKLEEVCEAAMTKDCGILVNESRSILYNSRNDDYAVLAHNAAKERSKQMAEMFIKFEYFT